MQFEDSSRIDLKEPVTIINPTSEDFICRHDTNRDKNPITYTLKSREATTFPREVAEHIARKLTDLILVNRKTIITNKQKEEVYNSIFLSV